MAPRKFEGGNRGKKSFTGKPENRSGKFGDRKDRSQDQGGKRNFLSKFSKKGAGASSGGAGFSDRSSGKKFDKGEDKGFDKRKPREGSSDMPHRAFSPRKKYFKSKEGDEKKEGSKFGKRPATGDDRKKSFERSDRKKPFSRGDKKPFDRTAKKSFGDNEEKKSFGDKPSRPQKFVSYKDKRIVEKPQDGLIRLNKFISNSGVCSRREADELIKMGLISVNGQVITEMGYKVKPTDDVRHESKRLKAEKPVYILLNKPKGFITTTDDPQERKTVMHLIGDAVKERIYPVGRLDRNTTGLLLLTNDGELADKLTHPSYKAKKIYRVELDKDLTKADFDKIVEGIRFEEGKAMVDDLAYVDDTRSIVGIELHIGWNRIVRRIFEALGYEVMKLDRVVYAGLDKKTIGRGEWRFLKDAEVVKLKHLK